jgi:hypothetical protein
MKPLKSEIQGWEHHTVLLALACYRATPECQGNAEIMSRVNKIEKRLNDNCAKWIVEKVINNEQK